MLQYKNGRFYMGRVSFFLPEGFYVEDRIDLLEEDGLTAWEPEQKDLYRWRYYWDCEGAAAELQKWFLPDCGLIPLSEVIPVEINGLMGHMVLYCSRQACFFEARFDLGEAEQLGLTVESKSRDAKKIPASAAFRAVWAGLRAEEG